LTAETQSGGGFSMFQGANALMELARKKQRLAIVTGPEGQRLTIRGEDADKARIIPVTNGTWSLDLHYKGGQGCSKATRRAAPPHSSCPR
jgi:hypothetical protein